MRAGRDYEAYVAARSGAVVRCLVLLGTAPGEAESVAARALGALRPEWGDLSRGGDVDAVLFATALGEDADRRRRGGLAPAHAPRVAVVLRHVVGLDLVQVCEVTGADDRSVRAWVADRRLVEEVLDEAVGVPAIPVAHAQVLAAARRDRRRSWSVGAGVVGAVGAVVAVAFGGYLASRPGPPPRPGDELPAARVVVEDNPAGVVWWANGTLHLPHAAVHVGDLRRVVAAGSGAAYVDGSGRLVGVQPDGRRTYLGVPAPRTGLVSEPRLGLVAWTDDVTPDQPRLVVWDVPRDVRVAGVVVSDRTRAIGFDGGWLSFGVGLRDWAWDPKGGPARQTGSGYVDDPTQRTALADVVRGTRLEQQGYYLRVVRAGSPNVALVQGFGGELSPDARFVLTSPAAGRGPELFSARTGAKLPPLFPPEWRARAATFTAAGDVAWLVDRGAEGSAIVTCHLTSCTTQAEIPGSTPAVLAQDSIR